MIPTLIYTCKICIWSFVSFIFAQKYNTLRYFIELSYFGKPYHGWQKQPNAVTVQQTIEEALSMILRKKISIMGAGRTDTGVHATQMFAHFDIVDDGEGNEIFAKAALTTLTYKLNNLLPKSIAIQHIFPVKDKAHTRFDALSRSYLYRIAKVKDPFLTNGAFLCKYDLDITAMNEAAAILLKYKDFECFSKSKTEVNTYLCDITEAFWTESDTELLFTITANRFLRNMVRAIVGTLIEIGQGRKSVKWIHEVIALKDRSVAGSSVPAHGLYLTAIKYPDSIYKD